ncbi:unnamed protein product [Owenia fusiformis]|uniref:Uncharacterized protein n=1 Tax=Owenia fusiformis TaxID=6347 RepID=A0A8J1UA63_OWEFU|nr:unnamed protein product [Owenia fusiformis]
MGFGDSDPDPKTSAVNGNDGMDKRPFAVPNVHGPQDAIPPAGIGGTAVTWGIAVGAAVGLVGIILIIAVVCRRIARKRRKELDLEFDDIYGTSSSRSAPSTRTNSPRIDKRHSLNQTSHRGMYVRSVTVDTVPDFSLPPERVQPRSPGDRSGSSTALQYQHSILGNIKPDLYSVGVPVQIEGAHAKDWSSEDEVEPSLLEGEDDCQVVVRMCSEEEDYEAPPSQHGRIWFSVVYDAAVEQLTVNLIKVKHLKGRGRANTPRDPFVKLYLLPDERTCQQSKVRKKTLTPKFNETFVFQVAADDVSKRTLRLSVYDLDKRRVRHSLGHVVAPMSTLDITRDDVVWRDLEPVKQTSSSLGEIYFSLCHIPTMDKVKVVIMRARNLRKVDLDSNAGIYVRVQLLHGRKVHKSKKTVIVQGSCDPVYNEAFSFTVPGKMLDSCSVCITVMSSIQSRLSSHEEEYGKNVVGGFMFARGEELMHWQEMLAQPRTAIPQWHSLAAPQTN